MRILGASFLQYDRDLKFHVKVLIFHIFKKYVTFDKEASNCFISNLIPKFVYFSCYLLNFNYCGTIIWSKSQSRDSRKSRKSHARFLQRISQSREIRKVRDFPKPRPYARPSLRYHSGDVRSCACARSLC